MIAQNSVIVPEVAADGFEFHRLDPRWREIHDSTQRMVEAGAECEFLVTSRAMLEQVVGTLVGDKAARWVREVTFSRDGRFELDAKGRVAFGLAGNVWAATVDGRAVLVLVVETRG